MPGILIRFRRMYKEKVRKRLNDIVYKYYKLKLIEYYSNRIC